MINDSQKRDPRQWRKWRQSGAIPPMSPKRKMEALKEALKRPGAFEKLGKSMSDHFRDLLTAPIRRTFPMSQISIVSGPQISLEEIKERRYGTGVEHTLKGMVKILEKPWSLC